MDTQNFWRKNDSFANRLTGFLLFVYMVLLYWIIVLKLNIQFSYRGENNINLIPYKAPLILNGKVDYGEMILNVLIFIPLGVYIGILFKNMSVVKKFVTFFLTSFIFEVLQFTLKIGAFDITDIINNTMGGILGFFLYKITEKIFKNSSTAQKIVNVIALIGTIFVVTTLLYLKINKLLMFRR